MSWLRNMLGLRSDPVQRPSPPNRIAERGLPSAARNVLVERIGSRMASVPSLGVMGQLAKSPDGRFSLVWQERVKVDGMLTGGRYVLIEDGVVTVDGRMTRPQDGKVANGGNFILNDWGDPEELAGVFHAFACDGRELVSRRFSANLFNNGLAEDGSVAVTQTCNAPNSPDSSILCVFDLLRGSEIACWVPEMGWADGYEFPGGNRLRMIRHKGEPLDCTFAGEPIGFR